MSEWNPDDAALVELPQPLIDRIRERLPETEFDSVDEYATAALDGLLRELDATPATARTGTEEVGVEAGESEGVDDADDDAAGEGVDDAVADRLAALGYR